jgi:CDP-paratose 2-epimerase
VTVYGDGLQVRDLLFVDDLVDAFLAAREHREVVACRPYNIGGGPARTASLLELISIAKEICGREPIVRFEGWRPGDQKYYVSDTRPFQAHTGWRPRVGVPEGVHRLTEWLTSERPFPAGASGKIEARKAV